MRRRGSGGCCFFFFNDTATTEIYTLSLHDALPIYQAIMEFVVAVTKPLLGAMPLLLVQDAIREAEEMLKQFTVLYPDEMLLRRSEEHTSELQSRLHLVCRLLLEKKKSIFPNYMTST